jgi:hypothetical protein
MSMKAPMTERSRARRPSPAMVIWGSVLLFAVLFAVFTYRLSAAQSTPARRQVLVHKVVKRRVVTTVVPTPGPSSVNSGPATTASAPPVSSPPPVAPVVTSSS